MRAVAVATTIILGTTLGAEAKWYDVPTDSRTTAEVRGVFVERLKEHRREVREHKAELAELARLAAAAEQAAEEAQDALNAAPVSTSTGCLSGAQIASYATGAGFPADVVPTMVSLAFRESGGCPGAINDTSGACGLWQIYPPQYGCTDPAANAAMAYAKYQAAGLSPWAL